VHTGAGHTAFPHHRLVYLTEQTLIDHCLRQDRRAQRQLYEQFSPKLMAVCLRYTNTLADAEDVLQEAFVRIFSYLGQYKGTGSFEGWMRRITVHVAIKHLQKGRLRFEEVDSGGEGPVGNLVSQPFAFADLAADDLLRLVQGLPAGYRTVFNLVVMEGFDHDEVAALLQIQAGTSRSQLVKARKMLQQQLKQLHKIAV
jgi:RNA polymerase sigma-70 factor (ECF subfamily)